jgi:hypothetical protein
MDMPRFGSSEPHDQESPSSSEQEDGNNFEATGDNDELTLPTDADASDVPDDDFSEESAHELENESSGDEGMSLPRSVPPPKNVQERIRKLNLRERDAMARGGTLTERVALERAYGAAVWEALLSNGSLTGPEVARIAKNGNVTLPHLNIIVGNAAWLAKAEVRRALLTNRRLSTAHIERILRALPAAELKLLPKQTAYSPQVRAAAARLMGR